jgi:hypothetical protein
MTSLIWDLAVFIFLVFGAALLIAPLWKRFAAVEAFTAGIGCSLLLIFLTGFFVHITRLPRTLWWLLPVILAASILLRRNTLTPFVQNKELRKLGGVWMIFSAWTVGLLGLVVVYSGSCWCADWLEHYERALFFLHGGEPSQHFYKNLYSLSARPPLANVVTAVFMKLSGDTFADFQITTALLGTLILFPAWLLTKRWAPRPQGVSPYMTGAVLMLNPMVMQNLTFAWTKLATAFWILSGVYFLLKGLGRGDGRFSRTSGFACFAAAMLTHYSAGPWIIVMVAIYMHNERRHIHTRQFWKETCGHAGLALLILSPWFIWISTQLGVHVAFTQNTTFQGAVTHTFGSQLTTAWLNFRDTIVPMALRSVNAGILEQTSRLGWLRDFFFNFYQLSVTTALGMASLIAMGPLLLSVKSSIRASLRRAAMWLLAIIAVTFIGTAVVTDRDDWGLAHICLQPLVILGLAWIAARLPASPLTIRLLWAFGAIWDLTFGIALHFATQALKVAPLADLNPYARHFNGPDLQLYGLITFGARVESTFPAISVCLLALLAIALLKAFTSSNAAIAESLDQPA